MATDNKLSLLVPSHIPDYVSEFYPIFITFVTKYYEWLEQQGNPQEVLQNIQLNRDIDTTVSSLTTKFLSTYIPNFPQSYEASEEILVKYFRDFYERKGSLASFDFFFRAFFNDEVTISRPSDKLFKTSDATWVVPKKLRVRAVTGNPSRLSHTWVYGSSSGAQAAVNLIHKVVGDYYDLVLESSTISGTFTSSETITGYYFDFDLDTSSQIIMTNTDNIIIEDGYWKNTRSQLSSDQVIQDSFYYQDYSYLIKSKINLEDWRDAVLSQLHPAGQIMFNEMGLETEPTLINTSDTLSISTVTALNVKLATSDDFYIIPGYSWDRTANYYTGTSDTTTAGAISYNSSYIYNGENVTFALQKSEDLITFSAPVHELINNDGPSFDKYGSRISINEQIIGLDTRINTSIITTVYHNSSNITLTSNQAIVSYSSTNVSANCLLVITWMKDSSENVAGETSNALYISITSNAINANYALEDYFAEDYVTSTATVDSLNIIYDDEIQRNYKDLALYEMLLYPNLIYYSSSNNIINYQDYISGDNAAGDSGVTLTFTFNPSNANKNQSYSRAVFNINSINASINYSIKVSSNSTFYTSDKNHLNITRIGI